MYDLVKVLAALGKARAERLARKPLGAAAMKRGYEFEEIWVIFNIIRIGHSIASSVTMGKDLGASDFQSRVTTRNVKKFVDDVDMDDRGRRMLHQLKSGSSLKWPEIESDFRCQMVLDYLEGVDAEYFLVVDNEASRKRAVGYVVRLTGPYRAKCHVLLFEDSLNYLTLIDLYPILETRMAELFATSALDVQISNFALLQYEQRNAKDFNVFDWLERRHIVQVRSHAQALERATSGLWHRGFQVTHLGHHSEVLYNGFIGRFVVPCDSSTLHDLQTKISDPAVSNEDLLDWMLDQGW